MRRAILAGVSLLLLAAGAGSIGCDRARDVREAMSSGEDPVETQETAEVPETEWETPFPRNDWPCVEETLDRFDEWIDEVRTPAELPRDATKTPKIEISSTGEMRHSIVVTEDAVFLDDSTVFDGGTVGMGSAEGWHWGNHGADILGDLLSKQDWSGGERDDPMSVVGIAFEEGFSGDDVRMHLDIVAEAVAEYDDSLSMALLFEGDWPEGVEPMPEQLRERTGRWGPSHRIQRVHHEAIGECPQLAALLLQVGPVLEMMRPERRRKTMATTFRVGSRDCDCRVDLELLAAYVVASGGLPRFAAALPLRHRADRWEMAVGDDEWKPIDPERTWRENAPVEVEDPPGINDGMPVSDVEWGDDRR